MVLDKDRNFKKMFYYLKTWSIFKLCLCLSCCFLKEMTNTLDKGSYFLFVCTLNFMSFRWHTVKRIISIAHRKAYPIEFGTWKRERSHWTLHIFSFKITFAINRNIVQYYTSHYKEMTISKIHSKATLRAPTLDKQSFVLQYLEHFLLH